MDVKKSKSPSHAKKNHQVQLNLLKLQNQKIEAESQEKSEFIVNIIHDLRSPLAGIAGLASHLLEKTKSSEEKEYAKIIFEGSKQLLDLMNAVIDSKEAFKQDNQVMKKAFHLPELIEKIREIEEPSAIGKHLTLQVRIDETIPATLICDELKIERILLNLISNAIKFTAKGVIKIEVRLLSRVKDRVQVEFSVADTGIGISLDKQDKVFKRYFKDNDSKETSHSSMGLGLDIVQKYVKLLEGEISLKSKVGEGTTVSFVLPMSVGHQKIPKTTAKESSCDKEMREDNFLDKDLKFLLIEDNHIALTSMKIMMDSLGIKPRTAVNSETAINAIYTEAFDVIITDIELPDGSGYHLSKKIRELEKGPNAVTIIGLTAHSVSEIKNRCKEAGMDEVYQKPLDFERLKRLAAEAARKKMIRFEKRG